MFRCSECGQEYKDKPDFCDCGNDVFEEIVSKETSKVSENSVLANKVDINKIEPSYKKNLPSIVFFVFCIILSFIILFFVANPKDEPKKEENKKETVREIPDIDKLWDDTRPKKQTVQQPPEPQIVKQEPQTAPKTTTVELKKEPVRINKPFNILQKQPVQKQAAPKQQTQPKQVQSSQTQKQPVQTSKQVQKPAVQKTSTQTKPQQTKTTQTTSQQTNASQTTAKQTQTVTPKQTQTVNQAQNIQTTPPKQQTQTINIEELKQYKKALRNKIASNINFLNVAGDGKCTLSFNISQGGTLINKKFVTQSQNTSLNDAVYQAMLQVSSFKAPPAGYKNETLKLTVKIIGGSFEVILE